MTGKETHIIKSQVIDMTTDSYDGFIIQQEISRLTNDHLNKEMALLFDRLVPADQWVCIDKLNIELDSMERTKLESEFVDKTLKAVEAALRSRLSYSINPEGASVRRQDRSARLIQALIFFLEKGYLPWSYAVTSHDDLEKQLLEVLEASADPSISGENNLSGHDVKQLKEVLRSETPARRFVDQFSDEVVSALVVLFTAGEYGLMKKEFLVIRDFVQQVANTKEEIFKKEWKRIKETMVAELAVATSSQVIHDLQKNIIRESFLQYGESVLKIPVPSSLFHQILAAARSDKELMKEYISIQKNRAAEHPEEKELEQQEMQGERSVQPTDQKQASEKKKMTEEKDMLMEKKKDYRQDTAEKEGIYIANAGMIILAPFLSAFFKQLGISDGKELFDRSKAVCLLQYLIGYDKDWKEYDMPLNKILCGAEPGDRVDTAIEITENEKNETASLLQAVIRNWGSLGHTSVRGLQESFLQRNGKLSRENENWLLQVEQKSYDMLLTHLPWTISVVKLPWMKCMLKTEWAN